MKMREQMKAEFWAVRRQSWPLVIAFALAIGVAASGLWKRGVEWFGAVDGLLFLIIVVLVVLHDRLQMLTIQVHEITSLIDTIFTDPDDPNGESMVSAADVKVIRKQLGMGG